MNRVVASFVLGFIFFLFSITGPISLLLSIPGLFLAISMLKAPEKEISLPVGYKAKIGGKSIRAQSYFTSKYLTFAAIGINLFSMAVAVLATLPILFLFLAGD